MAGVQAAVGVVLLLNPVLAWKSAIFWTLIGFALMAYLFGSVVMRVFVKYEDVPQSTEQTGTETKMGGI